MATILKIKRSSTNPTATPSGLGQGELAYGEGTSTYSDAQGATVTSFGKLFVGRGTETGGVAANIDIIGGKYFTDMLDHGHGLVTANSAVIVDSAKKVDEWNVDNITLNGNVISTTNANGDLTIDTNGTGDVIIAGANTLGTNLFNVTDGTNTRFSVDSFSGAVDITSPSLSTADTLINVSSTWNNAGATFYGIDLDVTNTASAAASRLINLSVGGVDKFNVDLNGNVYMTGSITTGAATDINIQDNTANAYRIREGTNDYLNFTTTNTSETITFGNALTSITEIVKDNVANAYVLKEGTSQYIAIDTTNAAELVKFQTGNVEITNDLAVNGGDITTSTTTATLFNATATTLSIGGAATTLNVGNTATAAQTVNMFTASTGASTYNFATGATAAATTKTVNIGTGAAASSTTNVNIGSGNGGTTTINSGTVVGANTTQTVFNTVATTVNFAGAATTLAIGNTATAAQTVNMFTASTGASTYNFATGATAAATTKTVNIGTGAAASSTTNVNIGSVNGGTTTINSGTVVGAATTQNLFNTVATTGNLFGVATGVNIGISAASASTLTFGPAITGNIFKIAGTTTGTINLTTDVTSGVANIFTSVTGTTNIGGAAATVSIGTTAGNSTVTINGNGTSGTANLSTNVTTGTANVFTGVTGSINYGGSTTTHDFGSVRIQGNTISTDVVGATQLVLDPFPTGGDSAGEVLIRGNLTVAGTTTTVNSTEVSINDPIFSLGDAVTSVTVTASAIAGATSLTIDNPSGIVETSSITGAGVAGGTTITNVRTRFYTSAQMAGTQTAGVTVIYTYNTSTTAYEAIGVYASKGANFLEIDLNANIALREDAYYIGLQLRDANTGTPNSATIAADPANNKVFTAGATLTLSAGLSSGITAPQDVTISQGADDNMDRGIQFRYYNGGLKTGFFGYDESGVVEDVTTYYFTYIPDATNTNNVFGGTIGSAYFKTVKINDGTTNGIAFYDAYKRLTTTAAAGTSDATTSYQILTTNASGVPVWTTTLDGGTY